MKKHNILLILTGGTICSFADKKGERSSDTEKAQALIVKNFRNSNCIYRSEECVHFHSEFPLNILSENMTVKHWNTLISKMKSYDYSKFDGVIILHGTDTLAYTSSLLSILLAGIKIPVFLVSSQLPIYMDKANGNANFRAATELIINGIEPNVYAVYRNRENDGFTEKHTMYVHLGAHLMQCANHSENFYSSDMTAVSLENAVFKGVKCHGTDMQIHKIGELTSCVLRIMPYVGIDYKNYNLNGIKAVLHGTYHSSTMSVNPYKNYKRSTDSIMSLKRRCDLVTPKIPLFIEPCNKEAYDYETTGIVLKNGAKAIWGMTSEMAYVKLLIGCSMGLTDDGLADYINTEINGEMIR